MNELKVGYFYPFEVQGIREENERKFIYLSNGEKDTFRVTPYDYQLEWEGSNLPDKLECYVKSINIWGLPQLIQSRENVLAECYTEENTEYAFKVVAIKDDPNTGATFYSLKDAFGLHHRYYPGPQEPPREIGDIFSLLFEGIEVKERNNAFLKLQAVEELVIANLENIDSCYSKEENNDVRRESRFGYENEVKEFKSSIVFPAGGVSDDIDKQLLIIAKTIAGFQNNKGGTLYLGVNDSGEVVGIKHDYKYLNSSDNDAFEYQPNKDGYENKIRTGVKYFLGNTANSNISLKFEVFEGKEFCIIDIKEVQKPIFLHNIKLYQRAGNMTQLLKGDEITYFIEERFLNRNSSQPYMHPVAEKELEEVQEEEVENMTESKVGEEGTQTDEENSGKARPINKKEITGEIPIPAFNLPKKEDKLWFHLTFYKDGGWSYQKRKINNAEVEWEIPIMVSQKKDRMMMVYGNGCVNVVTPYDIIKPKGAKGRKFRIREKIYKNGWNTRAKLIEVFCAKDNDLVVFESIDSNGTKWVKAHNVSAISVHTSLHLEGNVLVNNRKFGALLQSVSPLPLDCYHLISSLVLKDSQTSGYLGVKATDKNYQNTFKTLNQLIKEYRRYWKN